MGDEIIRAISDDGFVSLTAITSRDMAERARNIHTASPTATAALGRTLSAVSMLGAAMKREGASVTARINGGGPIGTMIAVSDHAGNARIWAAVPGADMPRKHSGKLDVGGVVGTDGLLSVIYDAPGREPHTGSVPLVSGEIAEDFTAYFAASEQTPAACALGVLVAPDRSVLASGGYIARLLPGAPPELAEILERDIQGAGAVTPMLSQGGLDALVERVMRGVGARVLERSPVEYRCYCSRERVLAALASISRPELEEMLAVGEPMEVTCQFCDRIYTLDERALDEIIDTA